MHSGLLTSVLTRRSGLQRVVRLIVACGTGNAERSLSGQRKLDYCNKLRDKMPSTSASRLPIRHKNWTHTPAATSSPTRKAGCCFLPPRKQTQNPRHTMKRERRVGGASSPGWCKTVLQTLDQPYVGVTLAELPLASIGVALAESRTAVDTGRQ